jgi:hypothetical protein
VLGHTCRHLYMNTPPSPAPVSTTPSTRIADLLGELRETREERFSSYLVPLVLTAAFGVIAWKNADAGAFFGALTVVFLLHGVSQRRNKRQIDLLLVLFAEEEKRKHQ